MKLARTMAAASLAAAGLFHPGAARADVVLDWNAIMVTTVVGQNPLAERIAAITQLAVFEAVNAITGKYRPYLGTIEAPPGASAEAAAIVAAHDVLVTYVPGSAAALDAARDASLAAIPDGQAKQDGMAVGAEAAVAMVAARDGDGSDPPQFHPPAPPAPGVWQATPSCTPAGGVFLHAPNITPFALRSGDQFRPGPPPALTSFHYARDYFEVKKLGHVDSPFRPQDRADVARFYAAVLGVATWNPAVRQVAAAEGRSLTDNARALALVNMALFDALVAVFDAKYEYTFWRPETAIRAGHTDGNPFTFPDPGFKPFVTTPCHPSYPSAHATLGGGAREVAERIFGKAGHSITLSSAAVPGVVLHYSRFRDIARDIDDARIYGGIHYRFDQEKGKQVGQRVGAYVHRRYLRPRHGHGNDAQAPEDETGADDVAPEEGGTR
jgi:hypothetical protein